MKILKLKFLDIEPAEKPKKSQKEENISIIMLRPKF